VFADFAVMVRIVAFVTVPVFTVKLALFFPTKADIDAGTVAT